MPSRRRSEEDVRRVGARVALAVAAALFAGCDLTPSLEDTLGPRLAYEEVDLAPGLLADRMKEIDASYAEPRTPAKVQVSYETSLISISPKNGYEALWKGARACAWIALNDPSPARRLEYAKKGCLMGQEAVKKLSNRVESHYYYAHCLGALAQESPQRPGRRDIQKIRDEIQLALALDPRYDHCGPHRFLGELMVKTDPYPLFAVGTLTVGLQHLETATKLCPDFGENHLKYAEALREDGRLDRARRAAERVLSCPVPPDYSVEHKDWLEKATTLIEEL